MIDVVHKCARAAGVCALLMAGVGRAATAQSVTPVPNLDLNRLRGTWYEVAKYPYKATKSCLNNSFALIALGNNDRTVQMVYYCSTKRIYSDPTHTNATQAKSGNGELKIKHLFLLHRTRDVLAIAPDDSWFVIGSANHKDLWIYSKTATMSADTLAAVESQAAAQGFSSAKLVMTRQNAVEASR